MMVVYGITGDSTARLRKRSPASGSVPPPKTPNEGCEASGGGISAGRLWLV